MGGTIAAQGVTDRTESLHLCILRARLGDKKKKVITVDTDIAGNIERTHYALVPSHEFSFSPDLTKSRELFRRDWAYLEPDPYMADGGSYRLRRYGLYRLSATTGQLAHIPGAPFYQSIEINPLHCGDQRHFASLGAKTDESPFLFKHILFDFAQVTSNKHIEDDWLVGVHQIRIIVTVSALGRGIARHSRRGDYPDLMNAD